MGERHFVILEYDSAYAAGITRKLLRPKCSLRLALACRAALDEVAAKVTWRKAKSHTGLFLNDRADALAKCGVGGLYVGNTLSWYVPLDLDY